MLKVALVYDRVNKWGGAERLLLELHKLYPQAALYTSVFHEDKALWAKAFPNVIPSFLNKLPFANSFHELYPWLTQLAFEAFDFSNYDLVITLTSAEAKSIITKPHTLHVCYCLTPTRYLWHDYFSYLKNPGLNFVSGLVKIIFPFFSMTMRVSDQLSALRPDYYLAISQTVKKRIKKYYHQNSEVIYPGIDTNLYQPRRSKKSAEEFFLVVSRLVPYKKVDIVIEAFNQLGWKLKIVGSGREEGKLKQFAKQNIEFIGELTDKSLISYYQDCQALIVAGEEDFCLTALEVQSCGKPVIALKKGGVIETVTKRTGVFFDKQDSSSLVKALIRFKKKKFKATDCRNQAMSFNQDRFKAEFAKQIEQLWKLWTKKTATE